MYGNEIYPGLNLWTMAARTGLSLQDMSDQTGISLARLRKFRKNGYIDPVAENIVRDALADLYDRVRAGEY